MTPSLYTARCSTVSITVWKSRRLFYIALYIQIFLYLLHHCHSNGAAMTYSPKKCHFLHFFGHIEIHRNLKTSKRPFKLKQSNKVSFFRGYTKKNQIASVGVSMFFYVTKKTTKIKKKKSGCKGEDVYWYRRKYKKKC